MILRLLAALFFAASGLHAADAGFSPSDSGGGCRDAKTVEVARTHAGGSLAGQSVRRVLEVNCAAVRID